MVKRYFEFIKESTDYKGGIVQGELPTDEWLNILCESLNNELHVTILDNRLNDIGGRLVHETDANYILNNKVYLCKEISISFNEAYSRESNKIKPLLELDKIDIYKLEKKIQAEEYKTRLVFSFGGARLVIYPKLQKPAGFTVISK